MSATKQTRIIALFLTLVVLLAATKMRTAEVPRPGEEPRICQYDTDSAATAPDRFILRTYDAATYLSPLALRVPRQIPASFSPSYRGPPELF